MDVEAYLGEIRMFAGTYAPSGWLVCDGSLLQITRYSALFSLLSTFYGGDGQNNFALPDLRSRVPIGGGNPPGLSVRQIGDKGGAERVQLGPNELAQHVHPFNPDLTGKVTAKINAFGDDGASSSPGGTYVASHANAFVKKGNTPVLMSDGAIAVDATQLKANSATGAAGNGAAHENMPPFVTINYIICIDGIYPTRP